MMHNQLYVMDFDNTLVRVNSKSIIIDKITRETQELSAKEFCDHKIDHTRFEYDQSQFDALPENFETNHQLLEILKKIYHNHNDVVILTARHSPNGPKTFLQLHQLSIPIITIDKSKTNAAVIKANWIKEQFFKKDYSVINFWDDDIKNISAVSKLKKELDTVKFNLFLVNFDIPLSCFKC